MARCQGHETTNRSASWSDVKAMKRPIGARADRMVATTQCTCAICKNRQKTSLLQEQNRQNCYFLLQSSEILREVFCTAFTANTRTTRYDHAPTVTTCLFYHHFYGSEHGRERMVGLLRTTRAYGDYLQVVQLTYVVPEPEIVLELLDWNTHKPHLAQTPAS